MSCDFGPSAALGPGDLVVTKAGPTFKQRTIPRWDVWIDAVCSPSTEEKPKGLRGISEFHKRQSSVKV